MLSDRYPRKEKLPHHHRSSSAAQNPQRCVLVACTRSQTIVMFLKALQDSRKKVPTLSLALYPSERAIMIGRLLIEPSFTDDERVAAPSNEGHSCGTVCLACSLHLNLLSPSTPPGIRYKHVTALSWHRLEQVYLFTPPSCTPRTVGAAVTCKRRPEAVLSFVELDEASPHSIETLQQKQLEAPPR